MTTLDELRRANLKEQKGETANPPAAKPAPAAAQPTPTPAAAAATAPVPEPVASTDAPEYKNGHSDVLPAPQVAAPAPIAPEKTRDQEFIERVHLTLARKAIHPTGVKATVDMSPELFWRVKRYCRDHNNVTMRQLFLDVVSIYLDEEGY